MNIFLPSRSVVEIKKHDNSDYNILVKTEPGWLWSVLFDSQTTYQVYRGSLYVFNNVETGWRADLETEHWLGECLNRHKFLEQK